MASYCLGTKHARSHYKAIYLIQVFIETFLQKYFVQKIMRNQTYCLWKHNAIDAFVFNKALLTYTNSSRSE
jgi:hypothetical protein